jgi:hypothetical protein
MLLLWVALDQPLARQSPFRSEVVALSWMSIALSVQSKKNMDFEIIAFRQMLSFLQLKLRSLE